MPKPPQDVAGQAGRDDEQATTTREQQVTNRETWVRAREYSTGEHEVLVLDRESAVSLREAALRAREEAEAARVEREHLLVQMRQANERLIVASLRADELAEHAIAARTSADEMASAEAEGRRRAEELTARLRASESAARESNRAKDDFVAMLGHELRNPLAPILIALDLIAMDIPDLHEREHAIIERQVNHLVHLVDDLLDTSRIRTGKVALRCEPIELAAVVSRAVEMAGPLIDSHDHVLSIEVPRRGLAINGDAIRLAQIVGNLLTNAAKFTPSGGAIVVTAERREATVALRIRDSGIGISKQMLPRLFDAYAQAHHHDQVPTGLGLGLAIVRALVEMHGGTVTAHSEGLGLGSEFIVELPAVTLMSEAGPNGRARIVVAESSHRILVVDDNQDAATLTAAALGRLGHDVRVAFDGPSALQVALAFAPDIVLLDLGLPGMDGYEVARRLQAELHDVEIIAVTGYGQPLDRQRSNEARFAAHLLKPVDTATLQRTIDESWKRRH